MKNVRPTRRVNDHDKEQIEGLPFDVVIMRLIA